MVAQSDFLRYSDLDDYRTLGARVKALIRRSGLTHSDKPEVVGQIMSDRVHTVSETTPVLTLIQTFADKGLHHVPVLDNSRRVVGIVTHSDVTAALYRRLALMPA